MAKIAYTYTYISAYIYLHCFKEVHYTNEARTSI